MSISEENVGRLFTTDGSDAWRLIGVCREPTATLQNLETGTRRGGAIGCLNLADFKLLAPPKEDREHPE